jgi:hypothetical protein
VHQTDLRTRRTPARLAFADHMNRFIAGDRTPRGPKRSDGQDDREHFVRLSVETGKNLVAWWPVFPESKFQSKIAIVPRNFALE